MQVPHNGSVPKPLSNEEITAQLAAYSNEIAETVGSNSDKKLNALEKISNHYRRSFDLSVKKNDKVDQTVYRGCQRICFDHGNQCKQHWILPQSF